MVVRRHFFSGIDGNDILIVIGVLLTIVALIYLIDFVVTRLRKRKMILNANRKGR